MLRKESTDEEKMVWNELRNRKYRNLKFRRQHVIEGFVVDFFCHELNLAIEIDGRIHDKQKQYDDLRQTIIESEGIHFIRVSNEQLRKDKRIIFEKIDEYVK